MSVQSFYKPSCSTCPAMSRVGSAGFESNYCTGFRGKKQKRLPKTGIMRSTPAWCPKTISPPACRIYGFVDEDTAMLDYMLNRDAVTSNREIAFPSEHRYRLRCTYPLDRTAKQFYEELQETTMLSIFGDFQSAFGEVLEIDDGHKPYYFYYAGDGRFLPAPLFHAEKVKQVKQNKKKRGSTKMGQYYKPILIDNESKSQIANSFDFGSGQKLMEHSWIGNEFVNAVLGVLTERPMRLVWMGDYADDVFGENEDLSFGDGFITHKGSFLSFFEQAWGEKECIAPKIGKNGNKLELDAEHANYFAVNDTKECYLDLKKYVEGNSVEDDGCIWCVNPLPLLTCVGNGQGGGDYFGEIGAENVGTWAFDCIWITPIKPDGYTEVQFSFKE